MKERIVAIAGALLLLYQVSVLAQVGNTRETAANRTERQPQRELDMGGYRGRAIVFQSLIEHALPRASKTGVGHGVHIKTYDIKKLDEEDYYALATTKNGISNFESLIYICNAAGQKKEDGSYVEDAMHAWSTLEYLRPEKMSAGEYRTMISRISQRTMETRRKMKAADTAR